MISLFGSLTLSIILSLVFLGYAFHCYIFPYLLFGSSDFLCLSLGIFLISISIVCRPWKLIEEFGRLIFASGGHSSLKSVFVGLSQFLVLQLIGWHLIANIGVVSHAVLISEETINGSTIVETAGTIACLIFAAFQTLTASAENQYEIKGRLRFDQNDQLYFYLRLTLSAAMGAFIGKDKVLSIVLPFAQAQLLLSILLLIPLISILFKSFRPEAVLQKGGKTIDTKLDELYDKIEEDKSGAIANFQSICNSLTQISIIGSWAFRHQVSIGLSLIKIPFGKTFRRSFVFLTQLEHQGGMPSPEQENFFQNIQSRPLKMVNFAPKGADNMSVAPAGFPKEDLDFKKDLDLPLRCIAAFFLPFRNMIVGALSVNGTNYANLHSLISDFIDQISELKNPQWRRSLYLMMLGEFVDGILSLPSSHNAAVEVEHLWLTLLQGKVKLGLDNDPSIKEYIDFSKNQFAVIIHESGK